MSRRRAAVPKNVVSLAEARKTRRVDTYRARLDQVVQGNRAAIGRLYVSGTLFTRQGSRAGRDLLMAHEHLLRVMALLDRLEDQGDVPAPRRVEAVEAVFKELDELLDRTTQLTQQTQAFLGELKRE